MGAIKSRFFPLRPEFEAAQSPVTVPTAELPGVEEIYLDDLGIRNKSYSEAVPWKDTKREIIAGPHHALNQQTPYTGWVKTIRNGEMSVLTQYKDGRKEGRELAWYGDGKKVSEETYKEGKLWTARAWKINGDKCPDTNVIDGTGVRTQYHGVSGKRRWRHTFQDGQRIK